MVTNISPGGFWLLRHGPALAAALLTSACASTGEWFEQPGILPLAGPDTPAREYCRVVEPGLGIVAGATSDCVWETARGDRRDKWAYEKDFRRWLEKAGLWDTFPKTGSGEGKCDERVAPYRFTLVSIDPTVILVTPQPHPELRTPAFYRFPWGRGLGVACLKNDLVLGTVAPDAEGLRWLSPDLRGGLREIEWQGDRARLVLEGRTIQLERQGGEVRVRRLD